MAKKKHCDKHYRYVATCPDCKALNEENEENPKRLYEDIYKSADNNVESDSKSEERVNRPEIPEMDTNKGRFEEKRSASRFEYIRNQSPEKKKNLAIAGLIGLILILIGIFYAYPVWHAKISLQSQLYDKKSSIDFWGIFTLNGWSTRFFFNKIGLIGAILGSLIMSIPPDRSIITIVCHRLGWETPSKGKTLLIWWTGGFIIFFIIGQAIETGYFALTMEMIVSNELTVNFGDYFKALQVLSDPSEITQIQIFLYTSITRPIIIYILSLIAFRIITYIVYYSYLIKDEFKIGGFACLLISIFFLMGIFNRPPKPQDGIDLIQVWSIYLGVMIFLIAGVGVLMYGKKQNQRNIYQFDRNLQKNTIIAAIATIIIILIPVFISIPTTIGLSNPTIYEENIWNIRYQKQIEWTRESAGIEIGGEENFIITDIYNYPENVSSSDVDIRNVIRQHDKENSGEKMIKDIKNAYETMADSDIIYISSGTGAGEYWVAPKTIQTEVLLENEVNKHTEIYDHVEGFIALDTSTGEIVDNEDYMDIFGVDSKYPIFFGEKEDTSYISDSQSNLLDQGSYSLFNAYDNDILLNTGWAEESNTSTTYLGEADGTLKGIEAFWYTINMGLTSFALDGQEKSYLINRNIKTRVQSVLMPGMVIDEDPYLVFDKNDNKMYYSLSIYTNIKLSSYSDSPLYRFLGVVLVDVKTGELSWYLNPASQSLIRDDPLGQLWTMFIDNDYYPWESTPDWLKSQLRYPESLWQKQLDVDYYYHVQDLTTWKKANDFYKQPEGSVVYYIETDLGDGLEFVGVGMVEYNREGAEKLAGLYVVRQGDNFGQTIFYKTDDNRDNVIGPKTAQEKFANVASEEISIIQDKRYGNRLLYPLAGSLYYYIPLYSETGDYEDLVKVGLINAFNKDTYYGDTLEEAYTNLAIDLQLNQTTEAENKTNDILLDISTPSEIVYSSEDWAEIRILLDYYNTSSLLPDRNITLNMSMRADVSMKVNVHGSEIMGYNYTFAEGIEAKNYTLFSWCNFKPGDFGGITLKMNPENDINAQITVFFKFDLIDDDSGEIISSQWYSLTFKNSE